jgi:hypothetical protein
VFFRAGLDNPEWLRQPPLSPEELEEETRGWQKHRYRKGKPVLGTRPDYTERKKIRHEDFVFAAACGVHLVRNSGPRYLNMPIKMRMSGRDIASRLF